MAKGRALKVCNVTHERCPELTDHSSGKCERHRLEARRKSDARRPSSRKRGYTTKWERFRRSYLADNPLCLCCGNQAEHVHHIDGCGPLGARGYDRSNLEPLCESCHNRLTGKAHGFAA